MRRLYPAPGRPVDAAALISGLSLGDHAPPERPYTVANFVSSADGRTTVDGISAGLGDDGDKQIFRALRGCADAILAGTTTMAAERYGRLARQPSVVALRARLGLRPQPLAVTVTRTGVLPEIPLLNDPDSTVLIYSAAEIERERFAADVRVIRVERDELTLTAVGRDLRTRHGVGLLLCEGGPSTFGALVGERAVDELFLTLASKLVGGGGGAITNRLTLDDPLGLRLLWVLEQTESLFLRYGLTAAAGTVPDA
jgi:5-amino-6-(5-phosphoribosylamino)uracil reductase